MKFPVDKCECGLDLTTAIPTRVIRGKGPNDEPVGGCPNCWRTYLMVEVTPPPSPEPEAISEPEAEVGESETKAPEEETVAEVEVTEPSADPEPKPRPAPKRSPRNKA
jgi:outer membrane biosynthesis protein TonB